MALNPDKKKLMAELFGAVDEVVDEIKTATRESGKHNIVEIPLDLIDDLKKENHPFAKSLGMEIGVDDLAESFKIVGVLQPIIIVPTGQRYVCLAGHRRRRAAKKAGLTTIPAIIREDISPELVELVITDTNLHDRKRFYPSEIAKAYKMQLDALKKQGSRTDLTDTVNKLKDVNLEETATADKQTSRDVIAARYKTSPTEISKYVRLLELTDGLLDKVDDGLLSVRAGYVLSHLDRQQQNIIDLDTTKITIEEASAINSLPEEVWERETFKSCREVLNYIKRKPEKEYIECYTVDSALKSSTKTFKKINLPSAAAAKELADLISKTIEDYISKYEA